MKKFFISLAFSLLILSVLMPLGPGKSDSRFSASEEENPLHPGWEEQYLRMKADESGKIPRGVTGFILRQQSMNKTHAGVLQNVSETGPEFTGGRTRAFIVDAGNSSRFLAGGVSGGVWVSPDKGITWTPVNDQQSTLSVTSLSQSPLQQNVIYFSTGESKGNSAGIPGNGIYKSTDTGSTFSQLSATDIPQFDYVWKVVASPVQTNQVYAGTRYDGLWRSTDAGSSWNQVFIPDSAATEVSDIEILPGGTILIGVNHKGIYSSTSGDSGTFSALGGNLPASAFRRVEIAFCQGNPSVIYAAYEDSTASVYYSGLKDIYKSTDAGASWSATTNPETVSFITFSFPWYGFLLAVKPDDPDFVMAGSVDMGFSTDGGVNWSYASYSHADYHTAVFNPVDPTGVYVCNDGGIHEYSTLTMDLFSNPLNNFYNVTQFYTGAYFPSGYTTLGGTQDNGTHKCSNGLPDFFHVFGGDGAYCQVNQQTPAVSYVSYQRGNIYRANDSYLDFPNYSDIKGSLDGNFDGTIDDGAWFINPFEINLLDGNQLYFTTYERIWRSTNGGSNWNPLTDTIRDANGKSPYCIGLSDDMNPTAYIGGEEGLFYRMISAQTASPGSETDLSATVPANVTNHFIGCIEVSASDPGTIYVAFTNYSTEPRIWKVTQALSSTPVWTPIAGNLPLMLPVNWIESDPNKPDEVMVIATDMGLYTTTDGGANWSQETAVPNVPIHMIKLRASDRKIFIFTHGRGQWIADLPDFGTSAQDAFTRPELSLWPNPADEFLNFSIGEDHSLSTQWRILDIHGAVSLTGRGEGRLTLQGLSAGVYFLEAKRGGRIYTGKFLVR